MKKTFILIAALFLILAPVMNAQDSLVILRYPPDSEDAYEGLSRKIPYRQSIPPYGVAVTYDKTTHIIFPSAIAYVDLGNEDVLAGVAGTATNVLRVKSAVPFFEKETNMSVITEDGSFYTFNIKFTKEPGKLAVEMQNFINDGDLVNRPNNAMDIYLQELGGESPLLVRLLMKAIYDGDRRLIKHIGAKKFGIQYTLKGIYSYNSMLYFHAEIRNTTNVDYNIDYNTFRVVDKKLVKRTTIQETQIKPVRAYNNVEQVKAKSVENIIWAIPIFTIPAEKILVFDLREKNGARSQRFMIDNKDLIEAKVVTEFFIN